MRAVASRILTLQALSDWILVGPVAPGHALVNQYHRGRVRSILRREIPALDERDAHGVESVSAYDTPGQRGGPLAPTFNLFPIDGAYAKKVWIGLRQQFVHGAHGLDSRKLLQTSQHLVVSGKRVVA